MQVEKIIERLGGPGPVSRACGITRQAVSQWREIPTRFVLLLAASGNVTPHEMRRDLYPHPLDGVRKKANGKRRR